MHKRSLTELVNKTEPAWPELKELIKTAKNEVEVLPASAPAREEALLAMERGHGDSLIFCFDGDFEMFYEGLRWPFLG